MSTRETCASARSSANGAGGPSRQRIQALADSLSSLKAAAAESANQPKRLMELDDRLKSFQASEQSKLKLMREELERTQVHTCVSC